MSGSQENQSDSVAEWLLSCFGAGLELNAIEHQANRPDVNIALRLQEELEDASGNPPAGLITAGTDGKPGRVSWVDFGGTLLHRPFDGTFPPDYPQHEARRQCAAVRRSTTADRRRGTHTHGNPGASCPASTKYAELSSLSFAGSPPLPGPVAGRRRCGSWARQTPVSRSGAPPGRWPRRWPWGWRSCAPTPRRPGWT